MIRIALLWHMHQPYYKDPFTGIYVLPWVRLHALKDYYGMASLLKEFPGIKVTFNLVPSLILQLEGYARGETDLFQQIAQKDANSLAPGEIAFLIRHFFSTNYEYHIRPYPRYDFLYQKREQSGDPGSRDWADLFSVQELRDLQVWFTLTHFDESYKDSDSRVLGLIKKGEDFSEEDKLLVKEVEVELLAAVIPLYKEMARAGQIEISTTPFYHPILPLLLDPQEGRNANPQLPEYDLHFSWPEDAQEQLSTGLDYMEKIFGIRPRGIWPSEGSLSEGVVTMLDELGVSWTAGDEEVLARSLGKEIARDASFTLLEPGVLYRPYRLSSRGISLFFRDHHLSDLLGFHYQKIPYKKAAADLVGRIKAAGEKSKGDVTVPIILDGENAWEYYPRSGRDFLKELMRLLTKEVTLTTATFSQCLEQAHGSLEKLSSGSWINGNFDIWIGDEEDRKGWDLLARTRTAFHENRHKLDERAAREAREYLHIAMGSDWFWWFGKENPTPDLDIFDRLFRENLRKVYTLIDVDVPNELNEPIASGVETSAVPVTLPSGLLKPVLDGEITSYLEWLPAGRIELTAIGGAMNMANPLVSELRFGFGADDFFLAVHTFGPAIQLVEGGYSLRISLRTARGTFDFDYPCHEKESPLIRFALGHILEVAIPLSQFSFSAGEKRELAIKLSWYYGGELFQSMPVRDEWVIPMPQPGDFQISWQV